MVVMDEKDYISKAQNLLECNSIYRPLAGDPTNKQNTKLIYFFRQIKTESGMGDSAYKSMYSTGECFSMFGGLPKICEKDTPLRPIVSSKWWVTYGVAKELGRILKPLLGQFTYHVHNPQEFIEQTKNIKLNTGEWITSYYVTALFTPVPVGPAIQIIKNKTAQNEDVSTACYKTSGVLTQQYLNSFLKTLIWTRGKGSHRITSYPNSSKII